MKTLLFLYGLLVNGYLLVHLLCVDCIDVVALMNHGAHYLLLVNAVLWIGILFFRWWRLVGWLLPGVFFFAIWYGGLFIPDDTPDEEGIAVATFNVLGYITDEDETFAVIEAMDADILGVQELRSPLDTRLQEVYPYHVSDIQPGEYGMGLYSRYPIVAQNIYAAEYLKYVRAVLAIEGQEVVVFVFHPTFPHITTSIPPRYDDEANKTNIQNMAAVIAEENRPVLLLCDCNTTPRTPQYDTLNRYLDDAFHEQGWGFGLTYPSRDAGIIRQVRIDYIWYSGDVQVIDAQVWPDAGTSDHHPVLIHLHINPL
jgi:endonuclease/exonuclease/phosphatase (EEP) superfamily protein YafD